MLVQSNRKKAESAGPFKRLRQALTTLTENETSDLLSESGAFCELYSLLQHWQLVSALCISGQCWSFWYRWVEVWSCLSL